MAINHPQNQTLADSLEQDTYIHLRMAAGTGGTFCRAIKAEENASSEDIQLLE
jgi:hypothetical protein